MDLCACPYDGDGDGGSRGVLLPIYVGLDAAMRLLDWLSVMLLLFIFIFPLHGHGNDALHATRSPRVWRRRV